MALLSAHYMDGEGEGRYLSQDQSESQVEMDSRSVSWFQGQGAAF